MEQNTEKICLKSKIRSHSNIRQILFFKKRPKSMQFGLNHITLLNEFKRLLDVS